MRYLYFGDRTSITVGDAPNQKSVSLVNGGFADLPSDMPYVQRLVEHGQLIPQITPAIPEQFTLIEGAD